MGGRRQLGSVRWYRRSLHPPVVIRASDGLATRSLVLLDRTVGAGRGAGRRPAVLGYPTLRLEEAVGCEGSFRSTHDQPSVADRGFYPLGQSRLFTYSLRFWSAVDATADLAHSYPANCNPCNGYGQRSSSDFGGLGNCVVHDWCCGPCIGDTQLQLFGSR